MAEYKKADYGPLRDAVYGVGFHWTTWTIQKDGSRLPFQEAVERFDVKAFVDQAREAGAGHVLLTTTHADHTMPCPNPEVDRLIAGRTCQRDLIMEIADGLIRLSVGLEDPDDLQADLEQALEQSE